MFGLWLNRRLYEMIPALLFRIGTASLALSFFVNGSSAAQCTALSGLALIGAALTAVFGRNNHRARAFRFAQRLTISHSETVPERYCESGLSDTEIAQLLKEVAH